MDHGDGGGEEGLERLGGEGDAAEEDELADLADGDLGQELVLVADLEEVGALADAGGVLPDVEGEGRLVGDGDGADGRALGVGVSRRQRCLRARKSDGLGPRSRSRRPEPSKGC